jgi:hypothetical protein
VTGGVGIAQPQLCAVSGPLAQRDRTHANLGSSRVDEFATSLDDQ